MSKPFFEIISNEASIDFIGKRRIYLGISVVTFLLAVFFIIKNGFNYSVDFEGGTQVQVRFSGNPSAAEIRKVLDRLKIEDAVVQEVGVEGKKEFLIRVANSVTNYQKYQ